MGVLWEGTPGWVWRSGRSRGVMARLRIRGLCHTWPASRRAAAPPSHRADEPPSAQAPGKRARLVCTCPEGYPRRISRMRCPVSRHRRVPPFASSHRHALGHSQWQETPVFVDATATSPRAAEDPPPSRDSTTRPLQASLRCLWLSLGRRRMPTLVADTCGAETHPLSSHPPAIDASDTRASRTWGPRRL